MGETSISSFRVSEIPIIRFRGVTKRLGGTLAVDHIDFDLGEGQINALLGANGAGKSTMIKILAGIHQPDSGTIAFRGQVIQSGAIARLPIAFIHQDLGLFDWMTVAENIAVGRGYARQRGLINWKQTNREAIAVLEKLGSTIPPQTITGELSRTEKSLIAIARALAKDVDVLVLDEPTSSLPEHDVAILFASLARLKTQGVGMIYVSHRLDEIFRIADHVTVLRDGKKVASGPVGDFTPAELVRQIVGKPPVQVFITPTQPTAEIVLQVADLCGDTSGPVSFSLRAGEVLGICGLRGAGQNSVGRTIAGIEPVTGGEIVLHGVPLHTRNVMDAIDKGIAFISSKREEESLGMTLTVRENLFLNPAIRGRALWNSQTYQHEHKDAQAMVARFGIRPDDPERLMGTLSGGNQQKVVLARWLDINTSILVMEEPTLGVDVGAKAEVYRLMHESTQQGHAVILVSSDLEEITGVCHRALIMREGRVVGEVPREELSVARLTALVSSAEESPRIAGGID